MNKNGQMGMGLILAAFISIVVGVALFTPSAQYIGQVTTIGNASNQSYTLPANGTVEDLIACGQLNTTNVVIYNYTNATGAVAAPAVNLAGNFTVNQSVGTSGYLQTRIRWDTLGAEYTKAGYKANVTCQFQPEGYITDGGGRSIASLVVVFAALAIALVALAPTLKQRFFD